MEGRDVEERGPRGGGRLLGGPLDHWNLRRFDPHAPRPHVESYFFKLNDPSGRRALWLKATIFAPKADPHCAVAESWAVAFDRKEGNVATKETVPFSHAGFPTDTFRLSVGSLTVTPTEIRGEVAGGGHRIAFDLEVCGRTEPMVPFSHPLMYELPWPRTKLVTPHPVLFFRGSYSVDGREVSVAEWCGMQGHNWGSEHAPAYAWCQCNTWRKPAELVLEGLTARLRLGRRLSPPLTIVCVRHRGRDIFFNTPLSMVLNRGSIGELSWHFRCSGPDARVEGDVAALPELFAGLYYRNPDGSMIHCLNSKIARATLKLRLRGEPPVTFRSDHAALEIGTRHPCRKVRMYV